TSAAERWIIMHESSGDPTADNPTSTAFGLGQLLLGNRILYLGSQYATTDCGRQLWAFRAYVRDRYGTAERAKAFWQANGWY
ncbi:MAG TPA: lytic transglycosylase domain-containing protein, partial [Actinomycetota bacterium]